MLYYLVIIILGLTIGSFLNVVIHRLPKMMKQQWTADCIGFLAEQDKSFKYQAAEISQTYNLATPRSACPHCGHKITALENIPVVSYLFLKGQCRKCKAPISIRYPLIELLTAILSLIVAIKLGVSLQGIFAIILTWNLIALSFIDYDTQYLPDNMTLPFLWLGIFININYGFVDLQSSVIGAISGYLILWSVYHLFKLITKKEGMGFGDFKLLALLGAWFGWQALPAIIILSSVVGAMTGVILITFKNHERSKPIPFGPYLAIAGFIIMLWGQQINQAYLNWVGL